MIQKQIIDYLRASYPAIYLVSHEEQRVERILEDAAQESKRKLFFWTTTQGLEDRSEKTINPIHESAQMLQQIGSLPARSLLVLKDFHLYFETTLSMVSIRNLKDAVAAAKARDICIMILAGRRVLPSELEKLFITIQLPLPGAQELTMILSAICRSNGISIDDKNAVASIVDAARGLSEQEAENAFALSLVQHNRIDAGTIGREKARMIALGGILEVVDEEIQLDQVGGLDCLKADLVSKSRLFGREAHEFGMNPPRGMLVVGQPGTGKSLTAKALKTIFNIPLLRLEAGKLFGHYVGESESNWRSAFSTARAISPCILWIDEADGLFAGGDSSGMSDGGVTQRVIKAILQDMQESSSGIFYCFTANDIDQFPDPIIDRLETWSVDLPDTGERAAIWRIQIAKVRGAKGWDPSVLPDETFQLLAQASDGFSGRQIERAWEKALEVAFNRGEAPTDKGMIEACQGIVPTSVTMGDAIWKRRERLQGRCRPASSRTS
jgi:ATP-dependent 26S proteasome regulatory subunit